jgi:lycopene beta-cyclase
VRTADLIAGLDHPTGAEAFRAIADYSKRHWRQQALLRFLNRMLFLAAEPDRRWVVMQRFYGLNQGLIERFYGGASTFSDKVRILTGKPPVAILRALRCLPQRSAAVRTIEVTN